MHVETAGLSDVETLAKLNQHVQGLHLDSAPRFFRQPTLAEVASAFREFLQQESAKGYLAYVGSCAVGYVLAVIRRRPEDTFCTARTFMYVDQLSVDPSYQRRGVGRGLLEAVMRYAQESGIDDIEVETWAFNTAAQDFFGSFGFAPRAIRLRMSHQE